MWSTKIQIDAVLDEQTMSLKDVMSFEVGQTIMLNATPSSTIDLKCGGVPLLTGRMGRMGASVAVRVDQTLRKRGKRMG